MATVRTFFSTNAALRATPRQTMFHQLRNKGGNIWQKQHSRTYANGFGRGGGYQYSRFQQAGGLMRRWAARPTFYYEAGGLAGLCGGFYVYNLEVVPVSLDHETKLTPDQDIKLLHRSLVVGASISSLQAQSSSPGKSFTNKSSSNTKVRFCLRHTLNTNSSNAS